MTHPAGQITNDTLYELLGTPVRYCPSCGNTLDTPQGFVHEYWVAQDRNFHCWCPHCVLVCTVVISDRITTHEPEH